MKTEQWQLIEILEVVLVCVVFSSLWAIAGSADFWGGQKWLRRFLAPSTFTLWAFFRSGRDWRYFIQMPLMMGSLTLPYGADTLGMKWLLRSICGLAYGVSFSLTNMLNKRFLVSGFQVFLAISISIVAGVYNPFANAMREQFIIGFMSILIPAMTAIKKNN